MVGSEIQIDISNALISFTSRKKPNTNYFFSNINQLKKNPKVTVSKSNAIPIQLKTSSKKLYNNQKYNKKKLKTLLTDKFMQSKYSKKSLYVEINSLKKILKKLSLV